jgi:hypothetical protein
VRVAAVVGAVYTLWLFWRMSERTDALYQGGFLLAALAVSAVIVSVVQPDPGRLGRALSVAPLRWVGRISYGLYLWHWPVYLTLTETRTGLDGVALLFVRIATSFALATASYYGLEKPIRQGTFRLPRPPVVALVSVSVIVAAIFVTTTGAGDSLGARTTRALRTAAAAPQAKPPARPAAAGDAGAAAAASPTAAVAQPKVMIVGDSVGGTLGLGFDTVGPDNNLWVWNRGRLGCGLFYGGSVIEGGEVVPVNSDCDWRANWPGDLDAFKPDVVMMLVGAWDILDREVDGNLVKFGTVAYDTSFLQQLDDATALLASQGAKVVVLTTPFFSRPELVGQTGREWPEYDPWRVDRINSLYRDFLEAHPGRYTLIDLNKFVSPGGKFTDELNGVQIRGDGVHFTGEGQLMVDKWLVPQLRDVVNGGGTGPDANVEQYDRRKVRAE